MLLLYSVGMSGAHNPIYTSLIQPFLPFKCYGHGCACDLAGKEMENCQCFVAEEDKTESCCSKEDAPVDDSTQQLKEIGCNGSDVTQLEFLDRHLHSSIKIISSLRMCSTRISYPEPTYHFYHIIFAKDKIPIS